jgi:hypothetical protein
LGYPARELSPYLTTGGRNPTPYQFFDPAISPRSHTQNTLAILQQRRVPYIISAPLIMMRRNPITEFIESDYELVDPPRLEPIRDFSTFSTFLLYGRKDANTDAAAPAP